MSKIFNMSEAASIGLHSMVIIARQEEMMNVIKISEMINASKHHVAKVLQRLVKDDVLKSSRGPFGGFSLNKKPEEISLLVIFESIEGKMEVSKCPNNIEICPFDKCILGTVANKMTKDFKEYLSGQTLDKYL